MGTRGKTAADVGKVASIEIKRPSPPRKQSREFNKRWRDIVADFPGGWWKSADLPKLKNYINNEFLIDLYRDEATQAGGLIYNDKGVASVHPLHKEADALIRINMRLATHLRISPDARNRASTRGELKDVKAPNSNQNKIRPMFQSA